MWGASARAHVHVSFARSCLLARSSIADQGVILVIGHPSNGKTPGETVNQKLVITSGARSAERVLLSFKGEISVCAARPDPVTLLRSLHLWNGLTDSRAVFFVRCHHSINFVFDRHRYPPVPATARGTCRGEGVGDTLSIGNSTTAGPIAFKFGVCLETS